MKRGVNIAELKSRLSHYLRHVRLGGEIIVKDRETPVARLVPYGDMKEKLVIRPAQGSFTEFFKKAKIPPALPGVDSLTALREDRADELEDTYR